MAEGLVLLQLGEVSSRLAATWLTALTGHAPTHLQATMAKHQAQLRSSGAKADPCLPSGFKSGSGISGAGNWEACKAAAKALLPKERCTFSSCSLGNVFTPPVEGQLIGIDNFFYVSVETLALCVCIVLCVLCVCMCVPGGFAAIY